MVLRLVLDGYKNDDYTVLSVNKSGLNMQAEIAGGILVPEPSVDTVYTVEVDGTPIGKWRLESYNWVKRELVVSNNILYFSKRDLDKVV